MSLLAGAHQVDTTPALGAELGGSFETRYADRVERPLFAKALALRSGTTTLLLISCDILMMRAVDIVAAATAEIAVRTQVPVDHILVSATHTHSGPATVFREGGARVDPAYLARVTAAIVEAAEGAVAALRPARLSYGQSEVQQVCFNRRHRRTDGLVEMNPGYDRDDIVGPAGPTDPTVTALLLEQPDGTPIAVWANLSLHYVDAGSPTAISSDYYGAFADRWAGLLGRPAPAQLTNGCSGDINNVDLSRALPDRKVARAELVATAVAGAAAAATATNRRHTDVELTARRIEVELERAVVTAEDEQIAADVLAGRREDAPFSFVHGLALPPRLVRHYALRLGGLAELPERQTVPVSVMTIGELCVVGLPGEIFVEHGLTIRAGSRHRLTAVVGLANDHVGYVPTRRACDEGGYETWRDRISWTAPGSGEKLVAAVLDEIGRAETRGDRSTDGA